MFNRGSGILLHITSLPSPFGIGDLGGEAYAFVDFLHKSHQRYWQVLPLNQTNPMCGNSPYSSDSAFASSFLLISPEKLRDEGFIDDALLNESPKFKSSEVEFEKVAAFKRKIIETAFSHFKKSNHKRDSFHAFCDSHNWWLHNYALFAVIKECLHETCWTEWPSELANRDKDALQQVEHKYGFEVEKQKFIQWIINSQWHELRAYANKKGIQIIGDLPIYVSYDSVDVWAHRDLFKLKEDNTLSCVAGVPPDYFSKTGQLWGNPLYRWDIMRERGFSWWVDRLRHNFELYDIVRIDHFRGLVAFWEVPAGHSTAVNGYWVNVPAYDFFNTLKYVFNPLPIIAEDLGIITDDVKELLSYYKFPGMKILQFAFGENNPTHPYLPHMFEKESVVYTGTHDNNTTRGWFETETKKEDHKRINAYFGKEVSIDSVVWDFIREAMKSVANIVLIPLQDILNLSSEARMNTPSIAHGNWRWRFKKNALTKESAKSLAELTCVYGRCDLKKKD